MPTSGRSPDALVDTSVAVALVVGDHKFHQATLDAVGARRLGLAGHAAFESFSVLTRLPAPARRPPSLVVQLLAENFPGSRFLSPAGTEQLLGRLASGEIAGGAVHDALVGAAAAEHGSTLITRDRRAWPTYRIVGAEVEVLPEG